MTITTPKKMVKKISQSSDRFFVSFMFAEMIKISGGNNYGRSNSIV